MKRFMSKLYQSQKSAYKYFKMDFHTLRLKQEFFQAEAMSVLLYNCTT